MLTYACRQYLNTSPCGVRINQKKIYKRLLGMSGYNVPEAKTVICQSQNAANGAVTAGAPFPLTPTTQTRELPASHARELRPAGSRLDECKSHLVYNYVHWTKLDYDFAPASRSKQSLCHSLHQFGGKNVKYITLYGIFNCVCSS